MAFWLLATCTCTLSLENSAKKIHVKNRVSIISRIIGIVRAVDVMRIDILMIKVNKFFPFFVVVFSKRNRKHVICVSIELYNHVGSLGELEKTVETLACGSFSHSIVLLFDLDQFDKRTCIIMCKL